MVINTVRELHSLMIDIRREGIRLKKEIDSEMLIQKFIRLLDANPAEIAQGCFCIYSMETFLYSQINLYLREQDSRKIEIYGSFVKLLYFSFEQPTSVEVYGIEVYRGMNLTLLMVDSYKEAMKNSRSFRWAGFTS